MKFFIVILLALIGISFNDTKPITGININRDTVPTGAAPQLFGSKLYEFKNYTLVDSFLMIMGGDTFAIPRWPALKYKNSDNRWYGYHGTRWRAFLNGNDTISLSNRIDAAVTPPGTPLNAIQYNNSGSFAGDSLQYYPIQKKILTSQDAIYFGRPGTGYFQDSAWNYTNGRFLFVYPRHSNGGPGQIIDPSWGADTLQPFFMGMGNALYDITKPENPVFTLLQFGQTGSYRPMASIRLEQKWYNNIEYHALTTKPHLMNPNDEIRHWSWTVNDQTGVATMATRSTDNRWSYSDVTSAAYDAEYAKLQSDNFTLKSLANSGHITAYASSESVGISLQATVDGGGVAKLETIGVPLLEIAGNNLQITAPGTSSGFIISNKSFIVAGKQLQLGGLANGALGFSITSGALGYIWQTNADANGYASTYSNGTIGINRDPLGFATSERMLNVYNNFNPNDSIFHVRANGSLWTKGLVNINTLKTTLTAPATQGTIKMVIADTNGLLSYTDVPTSYTFNNGLTNTSGTVQVGGNLVQNTTVNTDGFTTSWSGSNDNEISFSVTNTGTTNASAIAGTASGTSSIGVTGTSTSYLGVFGTSTSNTGVQGQSSSGVGVIGVSSTGAGLRGQTNPTSTNAIENIVTLLRTSSSGAGTNGIGAAIQYELETATNGNSQIAGSLAFQWTDATAATRTSQFEIHGVNSGTSARKAAISGAGQWTWDTYGSGTHTGTPTGSLQTTSSGNIIEGPVLASGTYTPTLTNGTNVSSSTASSCQYMRVGNTVTVSGKVNVTPTSTGATLLGISLPIASAIANDNECGGTSNVGNTTDLFGSIRGDATNDRAELIYTIGVLGTTSAQDWFFTFTYRIL